MSAHLSLESRVYRTALYLYPPRFRQEFGEEMARDFEDASLEALTTDPSRLAFHARMWADLVKAVVAQWALSGAPAIAAASTLIPLLAVAMLGRLSPEAAFIATPADAREADLLTLALLVMAVLLIVVTTIFFTVWLAHPWARRRGR